MTKHLSIQTTDLSIQKIISYKRQHEKHKSNIFMHSNKVSKVITQNKNRRGIQHL